MENEPSGFRVTKRMEWDAAHRLTTHEGKCATLHGHRYVAEVTCVGRRDTTSGIVVDFGVVKQQVGRFVDLYWDHTTFAHHQDAALIDLMHRDHEIERKSGKPVRLKLPYLFVHQPTAETIAEELYWVATALLSDDHERRATEAVERLHDQWNRIQTAAPKHRQFHFPTLVPSYRLTADASRVDVERVRIWETPSSCVDFPR